MDKNCLCPRIIDQPGQIPSGQLKEWLSALECVNRPGIRSDPYFFPISSKPVYDPILSCLQYLKIPQIVEQYEVSSRFSSCNDQPAIVILF